MKRKLSCIVLSTALVVSLVAGAGGEDAMAAKKAKLGTKKMTLTQGKSKVIKVKNKKKGCRYTFSSSKKKVATVTKKGKVKAVTAGTAKITVKEVSKKGKKRINSTTDDHNTRRDKRDTTKFIFGTDSITVYSTTGIQRADKRNKIGICIFG